MKDVVTWLIIEVYFIQLQDWGGELLKAIGEPEKAGRGERCTGTSETSNLCNPQVTRMAPTMQGLREGQSGEGNKDLQPWPQGTQPEQGDLTGPPVRVKLAHVKGWLSQLGQDPGEAHV